MRSLLKHPEGHALPLPPAEPRTVDKAYGFRQDGSEFWSVASFTPSRRISKIIYGCHRVWSAYGKSSGRVLLIELSSGRNDDRDMRHCVSFVAQDKNGNSMPLAFGFTSDNAAINFRWMFNILKMMLHRYNVPDPHVIYSSTMKECFETIDQAFPHAQMRLWLREINRDFYSICHRMVVEDTDRDLHDRIDETTLSPDEMVWHQILADWIDILESDTKGEFKELWDEFRATYKQQYPTMVSYLKEQWVKPHKRLLTGLWTKRPTDSDTKEEFDQRAYMKGVDDFLETAVKHRTVAGTLRAIQAAYRPLMESLEPPRAEETPLRYPQTVHIHNKEFERVDGLGLCPDALVIRILQGRESDPELTEEKFVEAVEQKLPAQRRRSRLSRSSEPETKEHSRTITNTTHGPESNGSQDSSAKNGPYNNGTLVGYYETEKLPTTEVQEENGLSEETPSKKPTPRKDGTLRGYYTIEKAPEVDVQAEETPKKRERGRPRKSTLLEQAASPENKSVQEEETPKKRGRGRPKKRGRGHPRKYTIEKSPEVDVQEETPKKRGRGRPRNYTIEKSPEVDVQEETPKKRGTGRPRKSTLVEQAASPNNKDGKPSPVRREQKRTALGRFAANVEENVSQEEGTPEPPNVGSVGKGLNSEGDIVKAGPMLLNSSSTPTSLPTSTTVSEEKTTASTPVVEDKPQSTSTTETRSPASVKRLAEAAPSSSRQQKKPREAEEGTPTRTNAPRKSASATKSGPEKPLKGPSKTATSPRQRKKPQPAEDTPTRPASTVSQSAPKTPSQTYTKRTSGAATSPRQKKKPRNAEAPATTPRKKEPRAAEAPADNSPSLPTDLSLGQRLFSLFGGRVQ
ncbi:Pollen-specific leucine-rich repeat extensin-like protein 1 [Yarrowia sp. B02]|nr:Pollen-specific leucine-rich repeat extensin-like protein 1 [Yarrowia sp. B02]